MVYLGLVTIVVFIVLGLLSVLLFLAYWLRKRLKAKRKIYLNIRKNDQ
jgi:hypothetical protein